MKCNNCGHNNIEGNKFCSECGTRLEARIAKAPHDEWSESYDSQSTSFPNDSKDSFSNDKDVNDWRNFKTANLNDHDSFEPDSVQPNFEQQYSKSGQDKKSSIADAVVRRASAARYESASDNWHEDHTGAADNGLRKNKLLLILLTVILVVLIAGTAIALSKGIGSGAKKNQVNIKADPNNPDQYFLTVRAKEGTKLVFEGTDGSKAELDVSSKKNVTFSTHVSSLLPQTYIDTPTVHAQPSIYQLDSEGHKSIIQIPEFEIDVPEINIEIPEKEKFKSDDGIVTIKGMLKLGQPDTVITINGEDVPIDENGEFVYSVKCDKGEHKFEFVAQRIAHLTKKKTYVCNVTNVLTAEQIVVISKDFKSRALNVDESIKVYGAVPAGAEIKVTSDDPDFSFISEPVTDINGNFDFEINLPKEKTYKFVITATLEDGTVFERPYSVERPPVYNDYVPTVWRGDYEEMIKPVHATDGRGFKIKGTIEEILRDDDYLLAKLKLEDENIIEIEYHDHYSGAKKLEVGSKYTLFGYSLGTTESPEGNLRMFIWFVQ